MSGNKLIGKGDEGTNYEHVKYYFMGIGNIHDVRVAYDKLLTLVLRALPFLGAPFYSHSWVSVLFSIRGTLCVTRKVVSTHVMSSHAVPRAYLSAVLRTHPQFSVPS